jgi:hypothetical protein
LQPAALESKRKTLSLAARPRNSDDANHPSFRFHAVRRWRPGPSNKKAGRDDQVIASFDDLSFGPINPPDASLRAKWVENELGRADWSSVAEDSGRLWEEARFPNGRIVAWLTRRSAKEYAGFLDWLWRLGDQPCDVIDLTDVMISYHTEEGEPQQQSAMSLGMLSPDRICEDNLWDLAEPLETTAREQHLDVWRKLRLENAPLRVLDGDRLVSAPISFFDSMLMSFVTEDWQRVARIIGQSLVSSADDSLVAIDDILLRARVNALVECGRLEIRGQSDRDIFFSEVRLRR